MGPEFCARDDRIPAVEMASHERAIRLFRIRLANLLAGGLASVLCPSGEPAGTVAAGNRRLCFNCVDCVRVYSLPPKSLSAHRLVLVLNHADSGDWNRPGWSAGPRRPLHVFAAHRPVHRSRLADFGCEEIMGCSKDCSERRRYNYFGHLVGLVVETDEPLARHRGLVATYARGDTGQ